MEHTLISHGRHFVKITGVPLGLGRAVRAMLGLFLGSLFRASLGGSFWGVLEMRGCLQKIARISHFVRFQTRVGPLGGVLHESHKVTTRPLRGLAVKALRNMPPILFNRSVLFPNRSITRCLEHAGDRQIFDFTVFGAAGSTYQGRRHAAEALYV